MNSVDDIVDEMTNRLKKVQTTLGTEADEGDGVGQAAKDVEMQVDGASQPQSEAPKQIARGWRLLTPAEWTPRPVGVF